MCSSTSMTQCQGSTCKEKMVTNFKTSATLLLGRREWLAPFSARPSAKHNYMQRLTTELINYVLLELKMWKITGMNINAFADDTNPFHHLQGFLAVLEFDLRDALPRCIYCLKTSPRENGLCLRCGWQKKRKKKKSKTPQILKRYIFRGMKTSAEEYKLKIFQFCWNWKLCLDFR